MHVRAHERAIRVIVLEEGNHSRRDRNDLLRRDIHQVHITRRNLEEVAVLTDRHLADEVILFVDLGVGLGDDLALLLVSGEVLDLVAHPAVLHHAIRGLDEPELVHAGVGRKGVDQADVRAFGSLDRADPSVMGGMNVTDLEARTLAVQTAGPEGGEAALVRHLRQRVDLIHELRELRAGEEVADDRGEGLRVDQLLGSDRVDALVVHRHAFPHQALGAAEADAALVGEKFPDGADAAGAEVVDVIDDSDALL